MIYTFTGKPFGDGLYTELEWDTHSWRRPGRYRQASQLLGQASRILAGLAPEDPRPGSLPLPYGSVPLARSVLAGPALQ